MSREQYQVPTGQGSQNVGGVAAPKSYAQEMSAEGGPAMQYLCGDCGVKTTIRRSDPIRCKECGCRVLYKERTKR
jgi:DNA-directed RNA polymerases I, II, and III subunit RPABC4